MRGALGQPMTDVVNIGIGGSDLGPAMATRALSPYAPANLRSHFVSNVDGADIADTLQRPRSRADPVHRVVEDLHHPGDDDQRRAARAPGSRARSARRRSAIISPPSRPSSTRSPNSASSASRVFGFWDWVGGRYSIWSSIGLPLAIAIGPDAFLEFLARRSRDRPRISATRRSQRNIPVLMGLLSVWNRNVLGHASQAVIPYDQRLSRFPAYLQQLQMESNGKSVRLDGAPATLSTGAVIWGEPGTNGQHAFFQLLHQGTEIAPLDFLVAANPTNADRPSPRSARRQLLRARRGADARPHHRRGGGDHRIARARTKTKPARLAPHKTFSGSRPFEHVALRQARPRARWGG